MDAGWHGRFENSPALQADTEANQILNRYLFRGSVELISSDEIFWRIMKVNCMSLSQLASTVLVVGIALLPTIIASLVTGPRDWEPEEEYDYR